MPWSSVVYKIVDKCFQHLFWNKPIVVQSVHICFWTCVNTSKPDYIKLLSTFLRGMELVFVEYELFIVLGIFL